MALALLEPEGDRWALTFFCSESGERWRCSRVVADWTEIRAIVLAWGRAATGPASVIDADTKWS